MIVFLFADRYAEAKVSTQTILLGVETGRKCKGNQGNTFDCYFVEKDTFAPDKVILQIKNKLKLMRKVRFKARWALSAFLATVLICISCVKNDPQSVEELMLGTKPFSSALARSLQKSFERDYHETKVRSLSDVDTTLYFEGLSPKWEFAVQGYSSVKNKEYLEVPIDAETALLTEGILSDPSSAEGDEVELTNSTYLAIEKSLSTGQERS